MSSFHQYYHAFNMQNNAMYISMAEQMTKVQSFLQNALPLSMDDYELASLKALSLFSPGMN